jgi:hypothetical protein
MWIETDHHGLVNLDHMKRIDLAGDIDKKTFGIYLFDVDGNTYPIVDIPRFTNIGIFQGKETEQDIHLAIYTFYTVAKKLIAITKDREVVTIEAIYKSFASEWYAQQKKEIVKTEPVTQKKVKEQPENEAPEEAEEAKGPTAQIHNVTEMKLLLDAYSLGYLGKFNKKPALLYQNEGKIARELVTMYPLEKLKTMLVWYFDSEEEFITKAHYDMKTFKAILERTKKVSSSEE